jgi:hypothetical protein
VLPNKQACRLDILQAGLQGARNLAGAARPQILHMVGNDHTRIRAGDALALERIDLGQHTLTGVTCGDAGRAKLTQPAQHGEHALLLDLEHIGKIGRLIAQETAVVQASDQAHRNRVVLNRQAGIQIAEQRLGHTARRGHKQQRVIGVVGQAQLRLLAGRVARAAQAEAIDNRPATSGAAMLLSLNLFQGGILGEFLLDCLLQLQAWHREQVRKIKQSRRDAHAHLRRH